MALEYFPIPSPKTITPKNHAGDLSRNFSQSEFACPCCGKCLVDQLLLNRLQEMRDKIQKPIGIESGYRCPDHNRRIPGAAQNSTHIFGWAVDIKPPTPLYALELYDAARSAGFKRIEVKRGNIHLDVGDIRDPEYYKPGLIYPNG